MPYGVATQKPGWTTKKQKQKAAEVFRKANQKRKEALITQVHVHTCIDCGVKFDCNLTCSMDALISNPCANCKERLHGGS